MAIVAAVLILILGRLPTFVTIRDLTIRNWRCRRPKARRRRASISGKRLENPEDEIPRSRRG